MTQFDHEKLDAYHAAIDFFAIADEQLAAQGRAILKRIVSMLTKLAKRHRTA
jgi:hypothetical protein